MNRASPKISIIVPVYNVENYLAKCLESLVTQTINDLEILVINDGSTDSSVQIIEEYALKYPFLIKAFDKENGGLSDARNFGLDRVSGDFVGFVDSDDYVTETMFEEMFLLAEKYNAQMVICNIQKVDQDGNVTQKLTQLPNMPERISLEDHFSVFSDISYFACNKLFKRDLFNDFRFKKGVHFEDIQLIPQLLLTCDVVAQTQKFHYQYLERTDSITKTHTHRGLDILKAVEDVELFFKESKYYKKTKELKDFQVLEGVYSYLAYLAFVKDEKVFDEMIGKLDVFRQKRSIKFKDILFYTRFGKNYLLYLPLRKKIFYLLYLTGQYSMIKKIMKHK